MDPSILSANVSDEIAVTEALTELARAGIRVSEFSLGSPSLDEVFLALTGKPTDDATREASP